MTTVSYSTDKHYTFIQEPMGDKLVDEVPGIGGVTAQRMARDGIITALNLYGHYLVDPRRFRAKVREYGGNTGQQEAAYEAMTRYAEQHN